jgi:histidinol-phosphate aminotransferase
MAFSRRGFLRALGTGMAVSAVPAIPTLSNALRFEPARLRRPGSPILLNSNENAYGPSRPVRETLQRALANSSRYPVSNDALVARLAALHHVSPESLLVGCGSTEMLRVLAAALLGPGRMLITASPTFEAISDYASQCGAQTVAVPLITNIRTSWMRCSRK